MAASSRAAKASKSQPAKESAPAPSGAADPPARRAAPPGMQLGDLYTTTVQLNNENKISTKNAFDLKLIEHIDEVVDTFMMGGQVKVASDGSSRLAAPPSSAGEEEHRFHEASCTIEASAKIYACRVDVVHTDTYKVLSGLNVGDLGDEDGEQDGKPGGAKRRRIVGVNTLERNEDNITLKHIDADEQNDPMFRRMAQAFDAGGAKGLLLSHLPIAEDVGLVFNQDVGLTKASETAGQLFKEGPQEFPVSELGIGDPSEFLEKIKGSRILPDFDSYRRKLYGTKDDNYVLPKELRDVLYSQTENTASADGGALQDGMMDAGMDACDGGAFDEAPMDMPEGDQDMGSENYPMPAAAGAPASFAPITDNPPIDGANAQVVSRMPGINVDGGSAAFDELFAKFCSGGMHQFSYFDQCWAPLPKDKDNKGVLQDGSSFPAVDGQLVQNLPDPREKASKKPIFDLEGLDQPIKKVECEPACRHQLNEKAAQWQLYKDVPPYMMDRITMPSWPTATKNNFTCLGLRHNLLLRLVKKPPPPGEGPHSFNDLYSTVLIQNHEEYPWLSAAGRRGSRGEDDEDFVCADQEMGLGEDGADGFEEHGLPAHLDVDPQDLFLQPDDTVIPDCDGDELPAGDDLTEGFDFDMVDKPATVGGTDIGYSRNSKFVDVKLVKKHLWDCISDQLENSKASGQEYMETSFQNLVSRTVDRMPKSECENLSVQVCFICQLHLCNEKNVEIRLGEPLKDFTVTDKPYGKP